MQKQACRKIKRVDRTRKSYYEEHTDREWGSIEAHQMMFNSSLIGIDGVVDPLRRNLQKNGKHNSCCSPFFIEIHFGEDSQVGCLTVIRLAQNRQSMR